MNKSTRVVRLDAERSTYQFNDSFWKTSIALYAHVRIVVPGWLFCMVDYNRNKLKWVTIKSN